MKPVMDYAGPPAKAQDRRPTPRLAAGLSIGCAILSIAYTGGMFGKQVEILFSLLGAGIIASIVALIQSCQHRSGSGLWLAVWGFLLNVAVASLVAYLIIAD